MAETVKTDKTYLWLIMAAILILVIFGWQLSKNWLNSGDQIDPLAIGPSDPAQGSLTPILTIIEFGDFQCPYCAEQHQILKEFINDNLTEVKHVWKDLPLVSIHDKAMEAAVAARCAQAQGQFWPMHNWLFEHQSEFTPENYLEVATALGVDTDIFSQCLVSNTPQTYIQQNILEAQALGLNSTPSIIINDKLYRDVLNITVLNSLLTAAKQ
ncbi:MAG: DsbA family protein [Patescibacteria group bacterium]